MDESPGAPLDRGEGVVAGSEGAPADEEIATDDRLTHNIYVVSLVSFFQDTASELLYPVLPLFVTTVLGAPPAVLGLIEGLAEGTASAMKAVSGRLADVRHRRPLVATGYGISSVGKLFVAVSLGWPMVLLGRFTDRMGKGMRGPPRDAIIADETTETNRGRAFGFHRMADTGGAVVGPLLGLAAYYWIVGEQYRPLFFIALIPAVISTSLVFLIREKPHARLGEAHRAFRPSALPNRYWRLMVALGLFALVNFPDALLLLRANELGLGFAGVVLVYVLYNVTYAGLSYPAGVLSDRLNRRTVFTVGLVVFSVVYLGFGFAETSAWMWVLLPLYGCYTALTDGVSRAWVADLAPPDERGTALGVYAAMSGVGLLVAGVWAGLAWNGSGHVAFVISGVAVACLAMVFALGGRLFDPQPNP